ncbi:MAG: ABC transporter substrate-binding protein [Actinobacteria bacterium]|nr:ABC transporter substrate-binding protein [Actinomycetota bacterium]
MPLARHAPCEADEEVPLSAPAAGVSTPRRDPGLRRPGRAAFVLAVVLFLAVTACAPSGPERSSEAVAPIDAVTVGSFNFPESRLLAEVYAQALESAGILVARQPQVGPREIMEPALEQGLVDVVPEYLGSALAYLEPGASVASLDAAAARQRLSELLAERGLVVLSFAPAENQNGVVVRRDTAERYGLSSISDLAPVAGELVFGGPPECRERPFCLIGLQNVYGLNFKSFVPLDSGGRGTRAALAGGEIDVGLLFTTDGHLAGGDLVLLADDRSLQPVENVVPVARRQVVERYGTALVERLDRVSALLTTTELSDLNRQMTIDEQDPAVVAARWLADQGLVG